MKASVLTGIRKVEEQEREMPKAGPEDIVVKVMDCGVCGSDVHYYEHGKIGDFIVEKPMILGHECAGEVIETGTKVHSLKKGDFVAIEPGYTCGKCEFCKSGRYNLCPDVIFLATPPYDGAFTEYIKYPADMAFKLPDTMDTVEGALLEPFCVGLHAAAQSEGQVGQSAAVIGSGCIGLCTLMALNARGISKVYVIDVIQSRLDLAIEIGAAGVINGKEADAVTELMKLTNGEGVDLVFETAGAAFTTQQTAALVKRGGTIVLVGMSANPQFQYDFGTLMSKEAKIHTVFRYRNLYPTAIDIVSAKKVPLKKIATNYYGFAQIEQALEDSIERKREVIKAVIHM